MTYLPRGKDAQPPNQILNTWWLKVIWSALSVSRHTSCGSRASCTSDTLILPVGILIGTSLRKPHTSRTTYIVHTCVHASLFACLLVAIYCNFKQVHLHESWMSSCLWAQSVKGYATAKVQHRKRPRTKMTQVDTHMANFVQLWTITDKGRQLADDTNYTRWLIWSWFR